MRRYRLAPVAKADLDQIWFHYAQEAGVGTADRVVDSITDRFVMLAGAPEAGRIRNEIEPGVRSFPVNDYIIYYKKAKRGGIQISRLIHGKRDQRRALREAPRTRKPPHRLD